MTSHLKTSAQFLALRYAPLFAQTEHFAIQAKAKTSGALTVGVIVPKKLAKSAVRRNAIRRLVYASSAGLDLPFDMVVRLRKAFAKPIYLSANSEILQKNIRAELSHAFSTQDRRTAGAHHAKRVNAH